MIEQSETGSLTVGSGDSGIELSDLVFPHGDALALYRAALFGSGLKATASVEAIGDDGLAEFLSGISESTLWDGQRSWSALSGLDLSAEVNNRGNVTLTFQIHGRSWDPNWSASSRVGLDLGDFKSLSRAVSDWFADGFNQDVE